MADNFTDMITGSLNLRAPWYVEGAESSLGKKDVHTYVNIREGAETTCSSCGGTDVRNGYEPTERVWRHGPSVLPILRPLQAAPCEVPALCDTKQTSAPFERKNSRLTLLLKCLQKVRQNM